MKNSKHGHWICGTDECAKQEGLQQGELVAYSENPAVVDDEAEDEGRDEGPPERKHADADKVPEEGLHVQAKPRVEDDGRQEEEKEESRLKGEPLLLGLVPANVLHGEARHDTESQSNSGFLHVAYPPLSQKVTHKHRCDQQQQKDADAEGCESLVGQMHPQVVASGPHLCRSSQPLRPKKTEPRNLTSSVPGPRLKRMPRPLYSSSCQGAENGPRIDPEKAALVVVVVVALAFRSSLAEVAQPVRQSCLLPALRAFRIFLCAPFEFFCARLSNFSVRAFRIFLSAPNNKQLTRSAPLSLLTPLDRSAGTQSHAGSIASHRPRNEPRVSHRRPRSPARKREPPRQPNSARGQARD